MISALLLAAATATSALGQGKVVVYTSNDSNLNRFVFEAFKKETGIEVEQVEAGSGVVFCGASPPSASARSATSSGA